MNSKIFIGIGVGIAILIAGIFGMSYLSNPADKLDTSEDESIDTDTDQGKSFTLELSDSVTASVGP